MQVAMYFVICVKASSLGVVTNYTLVLDEGKPIAFASP
jgi:hypothetical protein